MPRSVLALSHHPISQGHVKLGTPLLDVVDYEMFIHMLALSVYTLLSSLCVSGISGPNISSGTSISVHVAVTSGLC